MKKIKLILIVLAALSISSCDTTCKPIAKPKNLQPINWGNFNDAYTVFWNVVRTEDDAPGDSEGRKIKVFGWIHADYDLLYLTDNFDYATNHFPAGESRTVLIEIMGVSKKNTKKKCYVEGTVSAQPVGPGVCQMSVTIVPDTIYFEE